MWVEEVRGRRLEAFHTTTTEMVHRAVGAMEGQSSSSSFPAVPAAGGVPGFAQIWLLRVGRKGGEGGEGGAELGVREGSLSSLDTL